ncbi:protein-histidine kinase [Gigaspora margarita]|uniref:histidine kinase n=1 Tax=Gigaspora margarita TaxID=4874 RepID=A0A8H4B077_GIGMA|nr:protein-histidine kinase [Gigaspora margarita]
MSLSLTCSDDGIKNDVLNFDDMVYNYDWSSTLLGPMDSWEPALKNATTLCLKSAFPTCIHLGPPDWLLLYNKAFIPLLKSKHPCALGKPTKEVWPEAFDRMLPQFEYVKTTGKGIYRKKQYLELLRDGYTEESYFDYTFSPILKSDGTFCAIITLSHETTQRILHARRLKVLSEFGHRNSEVESLESACRLMTKVLSDNVDIPYALIYFVKHTLNTSSESLIARLIATTFDKDGKKGKHIPDYLPDIPEIIYLAEDSIQSYNTYIELKREAATYSFLKCESWPIHLVIKEGKHIKVLLKDDSQAVLLSTKISLHGDQFLSAILICGINQLRTLDEQYMEFLQLITNQMNIYLLHGKTIEEEKKRSKLLADLNYQKVAFFQGISHELKDNKRMAVLEVSDTGVVGEDSKIKGLDKGADDYLLKPFSARELIIRIRTNIKLSIFRRKILFQQYKQEATKQLLLSISSKIFSKSNLDETLQYIVKEIYHILPCERIFIISNERSDSKNNKIVVSYEDSKSITPITNPFMEMYDDNKNESQTFIKSQEYNNSGINICMNIYCDYIHKNVSVLSVELWLNNDFWGWIKVHRSPNSIWFDSEIELLQQISNQISLAITCAKLSEENTEKEIQIKAAEVANTAKSQILANTSHELRTPLGAIVGILTSFEGAPLTADQKSMINIMGHASDIVLSIINDILDAAKLEAQKITLINRTFDLLELFENIIENFGKKAGDKKVELIVNYDDQLPIYVKSDPDRLKRVLTHLLSNSVKFTDKGEILVKISMQSHETDENGENQTYSKIGKKGKLLIELYDTGIGMDPKYVQHAWKSFSQGDMSMTKKQDGTGLGLSICKSLVEINGGEINVESQLGKGSKFWFTWNFEFLSSLLDKQFDDQMCCTIRQKRILIIHPVENVRITMLKYLKRIKKVDAFDTFDKAIREAKKYKELFNIFAYDIAFISLYENNEDEVLKAALNLRKLEMNHNNLIIVFIVFPNEEGIKLAKNIVTKVGGATSILYTPITLKKLTNQFIFMEKNESINNNNKSQYINNNENIIKQVTDYNLKTENATQENTYECNPNDSEIKTTNVTNNKFIISVDDGYIENTLISKFQNLAIKQSLQK